ncbi:uncharacterized protein BJ212DRAFT_1296769 [Suillus subaureus]|uniref:Uncharacterized protein n=1 Tax=Suillus subaureus TaxID=48587 RepID=A0A9P7EJ74_9AGAM|nr:uncharacterized protein BJ212DRAFT_1296769 [Suillus subaureus]KAG1822813.1 hypothetical protein BJ212DRAFT_1296769 [Suillus subaureus]
MTPAQSYSDFIEGTEDAAFTRGFWENATRPGYDTRSTQSCDSEWMLNSLQVEYQVSDVVALRNTFAATDSQGFSVFMMVSSREALSMSCGVFVAKSWRRLGVLDEGTSLSFERSRAGSVIVQTSRKCRALMSGERAGRMAASKLKLGWLEVRVGDDRAVAAPAVEVNFGKNFVEGRGVLRSNWQIRIGEA